MSYVLSPRVKAARSIVAQQRPVVLPNPFGEAIAASAENLTSMMMDAQRIRLQRRSVESQEARREALTAVERANIATELLAEPGTPLGDQHPVVVDAWSQALGRDVTQEPELANVTVMPLDPDQKLSRATFRYFQQLQESEEPGDQELANVILERQIFDGESGAEALQAQTRAANQLRINRQVSSIIDRVANPDVDHSPEESRLVRNMIADRTDTPFRVEVIGPGDQRVMADQEIASTLTSQLWQMARDGMSLDQDRLSDAADTLVEALDPEFPIGKSLAMRVVTATQQGDMETLEQIAQGGAGARAAVSTALGTRARAEGLAEIWVESLPDGVRETVQAGLGQMQALRASGAEREDLLELAKQQTERARNIAERQGIDPDSLPMISEPSAWVDMLGWGAAGATAGFMLGGGPASPASGAVGATVLGLGGALVGGLTSGGTDFPETGVGTMSLEQMLQGLRGETPEDPLMGSATLDSLSRGEGAQAGPANREELLAQIVRDIEIGEMNLADARRIHDLTPDEIRDVRRALGGGQ